MEYQITNIPWPDPERLSAYVARFPHRVWLDSAVADHSQGNYSYLTGAPLGHVQLHPDGKGVFFGKGCQKALLDPWKFMEDWLGKFSAEGTKGFVGGVAGFLSYESFGSREKISPKSKHPQLPDAYFLLVDTVLVLDHNSKQAQIISWGMHPDLKTLSKQQAELKVKAFLDDLEKVYRSENNNIRVNEVQPCVSRMEYLGKIREIKEAILAGDCYQVNYSQNIRVTGDWAPDFLYLKLREATPATHMSFLNSGEYFVYSASPEILFKSDKNTITSYPIKGTRPRGATPEEDAKLISELLNSPKDRAELLMIVDLIRNDLGYFCQTGSVKVLQERYLETLPQVHHLVSEVQGRPKERISPLKMLRHMSPGGSITGAPKLKSMEWIDRLENRPRGIYTGSLGYCSLNGEALFNIAIRTGVGQGGVLDLYAGGGVVVDSDPAGEYQESLDKLAGWFQVLGLSTESIPLEGAAR